MASWCVKILNRLNLQPGHTKLVLDKTGVLLDERFVDFLVVDGVNFQVAGKTHKLLISLQLNPELILSPLLEVPSHLEKKLDITVWDYTSFPFDIEQSVAAGLSVDQLVSLMIQDGENPGSLITQENIAMELQKSAAYANKYLAKELSKKIHLQACSVEDYNALINLGRLWGEYVHLCFVVNEQPDDDLQQMVDDAASQAVLAGKLKNSFFEQESSLKSVDKIRGFLKGLGRGRKIALICFDGMGVAEWQVLRRYLHDCNFTFSEKYMFSLIPTMTKISRSAIYYGDAQSVYSLKSPNENKQFKDFFNDRKCGFYRESGFGSEDDLLGIDMVSVIYNFFDDIGHHTQLPQGEISKDLYFQSLQNYLEKSKIKDGLLLLKELGYRMYFCSDHGCVAAQGNGQKIDKYLIEEASKRATLINRTQLAYFYDVDHYEVPFVEGKVTLLAKGRTIFASNKVREISHGGITLEELIVPFVEITN